MASEEIKALAQGGLHDPIANDAPVETSSEPTVAGKGADLLQAGKEHKEEAPTSKQVESAQEMDKIWEDLQKSRGKDPAKEDNTKDDNFDFEELDETEETTTEVEEVETARVNTLKFTSGEQEFEVPEDAEIEIKVDGEVQKVSLKEVRNGLSGQQAIAKRFSALDAKTKAVEQREAYFEQSKGRMKELLEAGKPADAMAFVFKEVGISPEAAFVQMFDQVLPQLKQYMDLTPQQRELYQQKLNVEKSRMEAESARTEAARLRTEKEQLKQVRDVQKTYGLTDGDFAYLYDSMQKEMSAGTLAKKEITPKLVGDYYNLLQKESWASNALKDVDPTLAKDHRTITQVVDAVNQLVRQGYKVDANDVKDIVNEAFGAPKVVQQTPAQKVKNQHGNVKTTKPKNWLQAMMSDLDHAKSDKDIKNVLNKWDK